MVNAAKCVQCHLLPLHGIKTIVRADSVLFDKVGQEAFLAN